MPLQNGSILNNRYRILNILGQGGFGAVYRAADMALKTPCAVKENLDISPEAQRQFEKEATILANISHPNLPRVLDHFIIPAQGQYLVMDFIEGEDLHNLVERNGPVDQASALDWISQIADALTYLHHQNPPVIHRDIKPANIRVRSDGKAFLVDFGLVKVYDPHLRTTIGARAVTPGYSPPEQYGRGNTDPRTDVYALAATLYTLLTGLEPQESVLRVVNDQLLPLDAIQTQLQPGLGQVITKAMHLQPDQRFQSIGAFENALKNPGALRTPSRTQVAAPTMQMASPTAVASPQHVPVTKKTWFWPVVGLGLVAAFFLIRSALDNPPPPTQVPAVVAELEELVSDAPSNDSSAVEPDAPPTYTPQFTYTPYPTHTAPPPTEASRPTDTSVPPTNTREPTDTPRPTSTPVPPDPEFRAGENMFCRDGPGSNYEDHTMVMAGETVPVYYKWSNNWLLVGIDKSSTRTKCCWLGGSGDLNVSLSSVQTIDYLVDRITCNPK
jgi:serine/threonine protein kinase